MGGFEKRLADVGRGLDAHVALITYLGSALLLGAVDLNTSNWVKVPLLIFGLVISTMGDRIRRASDATQVIDLTVQDELESLRTANAELDRTVEELQRSLDPAASYRVQFDGFLKAVAAHLLKLPDGQRLTVYRLWIERDAPSGTTRAWLLQSGRYCKNPYLATPGRVAISADEPGCLRAALEKGYHFASGIPDPETDPMGFEQEVEARCAGMNGYTARNLRMKSRSILAVALEDAENTHRTAVIVIESEERNGVPAVSEDMRETLAAVGIHKMIPQFLRNESSVEPDPGLATRKGF